MSIAHIESCISKVLERGEKLFIPYVMCGDGGFEKTEKLIKLLEDAGVSMIEIGVPFSDPIADGPSIQAAGQRALDDGVTLKSIMAFLKQLTPNENVPKIMMTYLNPIIQYGFDSFFSDLKLAHVSGVIIPDLPLEEYDMIRFHTLANEIAIIPLVAPSTSEGRIRNILSKSDGFIYTVTVNGTTGARRSFDDLVSKRLADIKAFSHMPVVAGFGVSTKAHIAQLSKYCDGVVVGSKIVDLAYKEDYEAIVRLVSQS